MTFTFAGEVSTSPTLQMLRWQQGRKSCAMFPVTLFCGDTHSRTSYTTLNKSVISGNLLYLEIRTKTAHTSLVVTRNASISPKFCHMLKISQPIITLMSPYLRGQRTRLPACWLSPWLITIIQTYFSSIFFLLEGENDSSWRHGWLINITDR